MSPTRKQPARELYETDGRPHLIAGPEGYRPVVRWGNDNRRPEHLNALALGSPLLSAAMEFRSSLLYGDGVIPARRAWDGTRWRWEPCFEYDEVNRWLEENEVNLYLMEAALDMTVLNNAFAELTLDGEGRRIASLRHREATFSRCEEADPGTGEIQHHFYSNAWGKADYSPERVVVTPMLPRRNPAGVLRRWMGTDALGLKPVAGPRYVMGLGSPTPGRPYYARAWWESVVESGWLDFAQEIPAYKRALLNNGMHIKYIVQIRADFWDRLYAKHNASTDKDRNAIRAQWMGRLDEFLKDNRNSGKSLVVESMPAGDHYEDVVKVTPLRYDVPGGELLADLEEVSNILAYGMGVHPSLIGASPGKSKSINGTEARELFIIKQALLKPLRDRLLAPLYLVKAVNGWPDDLHFAVQNLELTTLDAGTGAVRGISQPTLD